MSEFRLTRDERKAAFRGTLKVLRRPVKPDLGPGEELILSTTRGGKQILDRSTGATIDMPKQPRLWITVKGWKLKPGSTEWETEVTIHDRREQNRHLATTSLGGIPREAGLKTRWGTTVAADGTVRDKRVPTREEQHENWTPETERGYGGRGEGEIPQEADKLGIEKAIVPATGVDDAALAEFSEEVEPSNLSLREQRRREERKTAARLRLGEVEKRGMTRAAKHLNKRLAA